MTQPTQADFEYAQVHPEVRADFIKSIDLEEARPFVSKLKYLTKMPFPYSLLDKGPLPNMAVPTSLTFGYTGVKSQIWVFSKAFDGRCIRVIGDFISVLNDHEGTHAWQTFTKPLAMQLTLSECLSNGYSWCLEELKKREITLEHEAYSVQLKNARKRNLSKEFEEYVAENVAVCYDYLKMINFSQ